MKKVIFFLVLIVILGVGWYFARPLFVDDVVEEDLPFNETDLIDEQQEEEESQEMSLEAFDAMMEIKSPEDIDSMSEEERKAAEMEMLDMASQIEVNVNESMDVEITKDKSGPVLVASGTFVDADGFHKGSGTAKLIRLEDGSHIVRLENFEVTNGPDLYVYLAEHENPTTSADVTAGFANIGRLKGNKGNQNYEIAADIDVSNYNSVVIWCQAFSVLFSPASLN